MALAMKTSPPKDPRWMSRKEVSAELAKHGFIISAGSLAVYATQGKGPPFMKFGMRVMYDAEKALSWARSRLVPAKPKV